MKREQEIVEAGIDYTIAKAPRCIAGDNFEDFARTFNKNMDFEAGARWADKSLIERARNWLEANVCNVYNYSGEEITVGFIEQFEKAMKE